MMPIPSEVSGTGGAGGGVGRGGASGAGQITNPAPAGCGCRVSSPEPRSGTHATAGWLVLLGLALLRPARGTLRGRRRLRSR